MAAALVWSQGFTASTFDGGAWEFTGDNSPWTLVAGALVSPTIADSEFAQAERSIPSPGPNGGRLVLRIWWSTEALADYFVVSVDGVPVETVSGIADDWLDIEVELDDDTHLLTLNYTRSASGSGGDDQVKIDTIEVWRDDAIAVAIDEVDAEDPQSGIALVYVPDHADQAEALMLSQDRGKPRMTAMVRAMGAGTQILEDAIFSVLDGDRLAHVTGTPLDRWGRLVQEPRGALTDTPYRRLILAKLSALRAGTASSGRAHSAQLAEVFRLATGADSVDLTVDPDTDVRATGYTLTAHVYEAPAVAILARIRRVMDAAAPAGIKQTVRIQGRFDAEPTIF